MGSSAAQNAARYRYLDGIQVHDTGTGTGTGRWIPVDGEFSVDNAAPKYFESTVIPFNPFNTFHLYIYHRYLTTGTEQVLKLQ